MTDIRMPSSGNVRIWYTPVNGYANPEAPTAVEINASLDISDAVSWNDFDFGTQASTTTSDPAITAKGNVTSRGTNQYGGGISFYYPGAFNDNTNKYSLVFDALRLPGTVGFITVRVDGAELYTTASNAGHPGTIANANDLVSVYKVETAGYAEAITGEEAFRYTVSFMPKGLLASNVVVRATASAPTVAITPLTGAGSVASKTKIALAATVNTRRHTRGVKWSSSAPNIATVSANGIVTVLAAGTANITATYPETGTAATAPSVITVSA